MFGGLFLLVGLVEILAIRHPMKGIRTLLITLLQFHCFLLKACITWLDS